MATKHPINASFRPSKCCTTKLSLGCLIERRAYTLNFGLLICAEKHDVQRTVATENFLERRSQLIDEPNVLCTGRANAKNGLMTLELIVSTKREISTLNLRMP